MPATEVERPFGKYRLLDRIAVGGMAEIYRARYPAAAGVTKAVVIKKILPALAGNQSFISMFINEAKIAVGLSHGNIAQVFDFGEIDGEYFLAMEYVHGQPLSKVMKKAQGKGLPALPTPYACLVGVELCKALHYAHTRLDDAGQPLNIIHRDVSPQNVLLSFEGEVKIVDFGIAKARGAGGTKTEAGAVKGKYFYFSPEQARTEELDARSDVFACGVVLYEMLCGRLPFEGKMMDVLRRIVRGDFDRPRAVNTHLPAALEKIVLTAMATDRAQRYPTAQALGDALAQFLYSQAPATSTGSLANLMSFLYEAELVAEGFPARVPPEFMRELEAWRASPGPPPPRDDEGETVSDKPRLPARELAREPPAATTPQRRFTPARPIPAAIPRELDEATLPFEDADDEATEVSVDPQLRATIPLIAPDPPTLPLPRPLEDKKAPKRGARPRRWPLFAAPAVAMLAAGLVVLWIGLREARVELTSEPSGALVLVDGHPATETTPLVITGLSPGETHTIQVEAPGMKIWQQSVSPKRGEPLSIHARLEPLGVPARPAPAATSTAP